MGHCPSPFAHLSIRLLALDIDGTLLDSQGRIPDENRRAIARAQAAGVEIVLATGRRYEFARAIFEQLPAPLTLILSNGAIVKTREGHTLMRQLLPRATARAGAGVYATAPRHRRRRVRSAPRAPGRVRDDRLGAPATSPLLRSQSPVHQRGSAARGRAHRRSRPGDVHGRLRGDAYAVRSACARRPTVRVHRASTATARCAFRSR